MKRSKLILSPLQKQALYLTTAILWGSGAIWLYLFEANPARPLWMKIHGAAAMAFLMIFGTLLAQHVPAGWQQKSQRPSGLFLIVICAFLIVSGWGLYYIGNDQIREWFHWSHSAIGLLLPFFIFLHVWLSKQKPL